MVRVPFSSDQIDGASGLAIGKRYNTLVPKPGIHSLRGQGDEYHHHQH
jgi:hypothetical protein